MGEMFKSYYAIIPAFIRYDKDLNPNAKLLYGEITALTNEKGYCWATNEYFASLYNVSERTITEWIKILQNKNYITTETITKRYEDGTISKRRYIHIEVLQQNHIEDFMQNHIEENFALNNIYNNIYNTNMNNKEENNISKDILQKKSKNFVPPTLEEIQDYCRKRNNNVNAKVFYDYFNEGNWIDSNGNKVKNWKQKIITWENNSKNSKKTHEEVIYEVI